MKNVPFTLAAVCYCYNTLLFTRFMNDYVIIKMNRSAPRILRFCCSLPMLRLNCLFKIDKRF